jgi:hypothetical protein
MIRTQHLVKCVPFHLTSDALPVFAVLCLPDPQTPRTLKSISAGIAYRDRKPANLLNASCDFNHGL